jgi:hypothetical protein
MVRGICLADSDADCTNSLNRLATLPGYSSLARASNLHFAFSSPATSASFTMNGSPIFAVTFTFLS